MADNNYSEDKDDVMSGIAQAQLDKILLDKAYYNAWIILSGQVSFEELLADSFGSEEQMIMAFDPDNGPKEEELQNMIEHWIELEEYERCAKLQSILDKTYPKKYAA